MKIVTVEIHEPQGVVRKVKLRTGLGMQAIPPDQLGHLEFDCGICIMRVLQGSDKISAPTPSEVDFLRAMHADPDERLACQCRLHGDVAIRVSEY